MTPNRLRLIIVLGLTVIVFGTLTLFFWDFVRETIAIPVYYLLWVSDLTLKSIPQQAYLALLIVVSLIIAFNTLRNVKVSRLEFRTVEEKSTSLTRYIFWRRVFDNLYVSLFSREQFARDARKLILAILAYQEDVSDAAIETMIQDGTLAVPDTVKNLIQRQGLQAMPPAPMTLKNRLSQWRDRLLGSSTPRDPQLDQQVEEVIKFIEQQLELTYARN
jgi:hypothetical protein